MKRLSITRLWAVHRHTRSFLSPNSEKEAGVAYNILTECKSPGTLRIATGQIQFEVSSHFIRFSGELNIKKIKTDGKFAFSKVLILSRKKIIEGRKSLNK